MRTFGGNIARAGLCDPGSQLRCVAREGGYIMDAVAIIENDTRNMTEPHDLNRRNAKPS